MKCTYSSWSCVWLLLILLAQPGLGQDFPTVEAPRSSCYDPQLPLAIGDFISLEGDDDASLEGMQITISQNYEQGVDLLSYENSPAVTGSFDPVNGILTLSGTASLTIYREVIRQVVFTTAAENTAQKSITVSLSNLDFLPATGHFYQYIPASGILWNDARIAASSSTLLGLTGYLATITSEEESDFLIERVGGSAWIGATDEETEGTWRWVTGPEGLENAGSGRVISGFINWNDDEPNNCCGGEDFAHMMDWTVPPGRWNDLSNDSAPPGSQYHPTGYMIEYGGLPGDPDVFTEITGSTLIEPLQEISVVGPISICPNLMGVVYTTQALEGYTYEWTVDGGVLVAGQGSNEIVVNWGATNANAKVSVRAISNLACVTEADLPVVINVQLEPPLPTGPEAVCFTDLGTEQVYNTPSTPGSDYTWQVTNGQITAGQGTHEITVLWDGPGIGTLFFTESTSTATDICDGDSPTLEIDLREAIIPVLDIINVSCFEGSDGAIEITSIAGLGPFSYTWNTQGRGTASDNNVSGLPAGEYSVDITGAGCTINVPFSITQPEELQGSVIVTDVLCFGEATGAAEAVITGGTGAYTYQWSIDRPSDPVIQNLASGDYSVEVIDENDCRLSLNFTVIEPPLLVIDSIAATLVSCPEGNDGTLEAFVSGGTPPYSYSWEGSIDTEALATGFPKGIYQVTVTDANGCTAMASQKVEEAIPKVYLPNAFSPNGDENNDVFGPTTACPFIFRMTIYDRWGNPVFDTNSTAIGWDGTIEGKPAPAGIYTYRAAWSIEVNDQVISDDTRGSVRIFR